MGGNKGCGLIQGEPDVTSRVTVLLRVLCLQVFEVGENKRGVIPPKMDLMPPFLRQSL